MGEKDCVLSERKELLPGYSVGVKKTESEDDHNRRSQQTEVRQCNLLARRERRVKEQPVTRQVRLERVCEREHDHERRAMEQPEARQSRLERLRKCNHQQRAAEQAEARQLKLGLHETGRLTDKEAKLKHSLSKNEPACQL